MARLTVKHAAPPNLPPPPHPTQSWRSQIAVGLVITSITTVSMMNPAYWWLVAFLCLFGLVYVLYTVSPELSGLRKTKSCMAWAKSLPKDAIIVIGCAVLLVCVGVYELIWHPPAQSGTTINVSGSYNIGQQNIGQQNFYSTTISKGPNYNGVLISPKGTARNIEFGSSGATMHYFDGVPNPVMSVGRDALTVRAVGGILKVSLTVHDQDEKLVAELIDNEWKVKPPPGIWDRNYNGSALEVRGEDGSIILQIKVLADRIQLQREWWTSRSSRIRMVGVPGKGGYLCPLPGDKNCPLIVPIFKYPSETHLGELVDQ